MPLQLLLVLSTLLYQSTQLVLKLNQFKCLTIWLLIQLLQLINSLLHLLLVQLQLLWPLEWFPLKIHTLLLKNWLSTTQLLHILLQLEQYLSLFLHLLLHLLFLLPQSRGNLLVSLKLLEELLKLLQLPILPLKLHLQLIMRCTQLIQSHLIVLLLLL